MLSKRLFLGAVQANVSLIALTVCGSAMAQDAAPADTDSNFSSGEIIVTAERREGTASTTPLSITAIGGEDLVNAGVQTADDLVKLVPGLSVTPSIYGTPLFNIRGLSFDTFNMSSTSPVGTYVDEVAYAYPITTAGVIFDLQRVEALKGPQGTLFGRNTTGGLVNFITNQPTDYFDASMTLEAGNYETVNTRGFISGPLGPTLSARLAWQANNSGKGWQESITRPGDRLGEVEKQAVRAIVAWEPSADFKATLSANYWHDGSDTQAPQAAYFVPSFSDFAIPENIATQYLLTHGAKNSQADWEAQSYQPAPNTSSTRPPFEKDNEFYGLAADLEYHLSDALSVYSLTAFNHFDRLETASLDGTALEMQSVTPTGTIKSFSQELRLAGEGEGYNWMIGGYYSHDKLTEVLFGYNNDISNIGLLRFVASTLDDPRYTPTQIAEGFRRWSAPSDFNNRSASVFANGEIDLTDTLAIGAGVRYAKDRSRYAGCAGDAEGNTLPLWNTAFAAVVGAYPNYNVQPDGCMTFAVDSNGVLLLDENGLPLAPVPVQGLLKEDNISWRGTIDWSATPTTLIYGTVARGYKSGAFPILGATTSRQFEPARQEQVTSFELGAKTRFGPARVTIAGFYNDYQDKQVFGAIPDIALGSVQRIVNIPKSETYGGEFSIDWTIAPGLSARGLAAYTRTKVIEYTGFDTFGHLLDFSGTEFPNTPRWQISGDLAYETPVSDNKNVELLLNASYQSRSHGDFQDFDSYDTHPGVPTINENIFNIPGYALVNGNVALVDTRDDWRASLWVKNLLDKNYWRTATPSSIDLVPRYAGMPRTYGVSLTFNFGG